MLARETRYCPVKWSTLGRVLTNTDGPWVRSNRKTGDQTVKTLETRCATFLETPLAEISTFSVDRWRSAYLRRTVGSRDPTASTARRTEQRPPDRTGVARKSG